MQSRSFLYFNSSTRPSSIRRCKVTEASALSFIARLTLVPEQERSSGTEFRYAPRRTASASINCSTEPTGSLAKYFPSILKTFPSPSRASKAAWRSRRLELLTLSSSVLVRDLVFKNFNSASFSLGCTSMADGNPLSNHLFEHSSLRGIPLPAFLRLRLSRHLANKL